jgi:hypothetical protein
MPSHNNNNLLQYASMATQLMVGLLLSVWLGLKADTWLKFSTPVFVWLFPLVVIAAFIIKVIKDTSKKK